MIPFPGMFKYGNIASVLNNGNYELPSMANPYPSERRIVRCTTDGTYIYVYGGYINNTTLTNELWRYNPENNTWLQLSNSNISAYLRSAFCYINGSLYLYGGNNASSTSTGLMIKYDISTDTWSNVTYTANSTLGTTRTYCNFVSDGTNLFLTGANSDNNGSLLRFNIIDSTWTVLTACPEGTRNAPTGGTNLCLIDDKIYALTRTGTLYIYSISTNTWSTAISTVDTNFGNLVNSNGHLYIIKISGVYRLVGSEVVLVKKSSDGAKGYYGSDNCSLNGTEFYQFFGASISTALSTDVYKII